MIDRRPTPLPRAELVLGPRVPPAWAVVRAVAVVTGAMLLWGLAAAGSVLGFCYPQVAVLGLVIGAGVAGTAEPRRAWQVHVRGRA